MNGNTQRIFLKNQVEKETKPYIHIFNRCDTAEIIFSNNLGKEVIIELITTNKYTEQVSGILVGLRCNNILVRDREGFIRMCRYEDIRYLI